MNNFDYKNIYRAISTIVNEIDPAFLNGPEDEYEYQVNQIIKIYKSKNNWPEDLENALVKLFFGNQKNITYDEKNKIKILSERLREI